MTHLRTEWKLNLKTVSEGNSSEHWTASYKRHQIQKKVISWQFLAYPPNVILPCCVKLIRVSTRALDVGDNLPMSMKYIRDSIADCLIPGRPPGFADSSHLIKWEYDQVKGKPQGIIVQFFECDPQTHRL